MALGVWGAGEWVPSQDLAFFRLLQVFRNPDTWDGSTGEAREVRAEQPVAQDDLELRTLLPPPPECCSGCRPIRSCSF